MRRTVIGTIFVAALVVAGCADDDGDSAGETNAPTSASAASTAAPDTSTATASAGLDPTFGIDGILATPISDADNDRYISVVHGPDGQLYAAGFTSVGEDHLFAVSRFDPDGTLDPTFGTGGTASVNVTEGGGGAEVGRGLAVHDDGTVVVAGPAEHDPSAEGEAAGDLDVAVIRFTPDGELDTTFGTGGIARIDLGVGKVIDEETFITDNAWGLTAREGGYAVNATTPNQSPDRTDVDFAIVGLTASGQIDPGFGTNGVVIADLNASADSARNIGVQADGKIVATGYSRDTADVVSPVLIRLTNAGVLDAEFGTNGLANHVVLEGVTEAYQWASQGENYVLAGYGRGADSEEKVDLVAYRFLADGSFDPSFGTDGVTRLDLTGEDDRARYLTVLPNGNILLAGSGKLDAENIDAMAVMLDPEGAFVETFGDGGHLLVELGGPADAFFGASVSDDGATALLAGFKGADPDGTENDDAVLARLTL